MFCRGNRYTRTAYLIQENVCNISFFKGLFKKIMSGERFHLITCKFFFSSFFFSKIERENDTVFVCDSMHFSESVKVIAFLV